MSNTKSARPQVLVADDQQDVLEALRLLLKSEGFVARTTQSPAGVRQALSRDDFDVLLMDLNYTRDTTSGKEGLELLADLGERYPELRIVVMTAWSSVNLAVKAMHNGAADFVEKPWDNTRLTNILQTQCDYARALKQQRRLSAENDFLKEALDKGPFVAESAPMQKVLDIVERVASSDASILLTGDNGSGKGLIAELIHERSSRARGPFVTVNTGGLSDAIFESEMFGHEKGAFTDAKQRRLGRFEVADGGTLFLDEIGNLPETQQAKLLQVLEKGRFERLGSSQTQSVNVRLIAATNANLRRRVEEGGFRRDLFFRLNTVEVHIPPLNQRRDDILPLARLFLHRHAERYGKPIGGLSQRAVNALLAHPWPGNVRELDHVIERAVLMSRRSQIDKDDLGLIPPSSEATADELGVIPIAEAERLLIRNALDRFEGNVVDAASALGLSRSALYRRIEKYGL